ncbi:Fanconi anemia group I protein-like isoform X2 [Pomacea canaliculata]|uniref:Fanconi anemia group I protein-like isoform X2 n=1 Tax=Pomacea canaliculata TaxID=400727 RepID=UPI000D72E25C|nr:Fanconi anemia group I protein-like isoform X2 [Pomacea canaliculata]
MLTDNMEKEIQRLLRKGEKSELKAYLQKQKIEDLKTAAEKSLFSKKDDSRQVISAILQELDTHNEEGLEKFVSVFKHLLFLLGKVESNNRLADDIVGLLLMEANRLTGAGLVELSQFFVDSVKNNTLQGGKAINVFPKILSVMDSQESIVCSDSSMKGSQFKGHIINNLCSCKWSSQTVLHLAAMFKDVPLTDQELQFVLEKIIRQFDDLDLRDLPSLAYQLLLLCSKGHKRMILEGLASFFIAKDTLARGQSNVLDSEDLMEETINTDILRQIEGTVILHISFAVMEQRELGQEFLKYLKAWQFSCASRVLTPFNVAVALSIVGMNILSEQILDFLKSTVLRSFRDRHRHQQSFWVRENFPEQEDIEELLLETVSNSSSGWEHVVKGLVQLGFLLMDSFGPRLVFGRQEVITVGRLTPNQSACQLGSKILQKMFKGHEVVRSDVLSQIFNRVMTEGSAPASHYLSLLSEIVFSCPVLLLESQAKVREVFDCLPMLPPDTAQGLLVALLPLLKISMSLRDAVMLLLRKSIFSRQLDERKVGLQGFLAILKSFKVLGGVPSSQESQSSQLFYSSQIPVDVHNQYNRTCNEALCLEVLGILQRCLSQQADIRLSLYKGLVDVISRNTQLKARIIEMLFKQVKRYYEQQAEIMPPLKLELCLTASGENVYLAEPLAHLISCVQQCITRARLIQAKVTDQDLDDSDQEGSGKSLEELEDMLDSLTNRMIQADMEDFELDKAADFSTANSVGVRNNIYAILLLGTYEVLMEHNLTVATLSAGGSEHVTQLFSKYKTVCDVLKEKSGGGKKGRQGASSHKIPNSLLSLACVVHTLDALFNDETPSHKESLEHLRVNSDFVGYIVLVALQKLQQLVDKGTCDETNCSPQKVFEYCCTLARLFLTQYMENQLSAESRERSRKMVGSCLEGLVHVFTFASANGEDAMKQCLAAIVKTEDDPDIHSHIKRFQRLLNNILSADDDERCLKDIGGLMAIIRLLMVHLKPYDPEYEQVVTWTHKLCVDYNLDDIPLSKLFLSTLLKLSTQMKNLPQLLRDMMQDLHSQLGDIDREVTVEDRTHFCQINTRTAIHVVPLVLSSVDGDLEDTDWVLARMKADTTQQLPCDEAILGPTQQEGFEKLICGRMIILVQGFHELVQSAVSLGPSVAAIFKSLTKLYLTFLGLIKYYLHLYTTRTGHVSSRFEKLVKIIGTHLTPYVYTFITYVQTLENEQLAEISDPKDKKKTKGGKTHTAKLKVGGKQDKIIPNLIFAIEELERHLVKLSKKSKINLMENIKTSTSRDFRINVAIVQESLQVTSSDEEEEQRTETLEKRSNDETKDPKESKKTKEKEGDDEPELKKRKLGRKQNTK